MLTVCGGSQSPDPLARMHTMTKRSPRDSRASVAAYQSPPLRGGFNRPYSASTKSDDSVQQLFGCAQPPAVLGNDRQAALECLGGEPSQMRRDDDILQLEQSIVCADGLAGKYIKTSTAQMPARQRLEKGRPVDERTPRRVDEHAAALNGGERGSVDHSLHGSLLFTTRRLNEVAVRPQNTSEAAPRDE